jgi:GFO/IDH/MocA oxidoreductase family protein
VRAIVVGAGAVGSRAARQLASTSEVTSVRVTDLVEERAQAVVASLGARAEWSSAPSLEDADVLVVASPDNLELVDGAVAQGVHVVSVVDDATEVRALLERDGAARRAGVTLAVGAAMAPGLSCVLARLSASRLDGVDEVHVAKLGTGGPRCAHTHHRALRSVALDWRAGEWVHHRPGSGRELAWFPEPVGGRDCYRAGIPDTMLLVPAFGGVERVTARVAANRRDRMTSRLPMLRSPHPEGEVGAVRVEVRGRRAGVRIADVFGAIDRPAVAAGAVAAVAAVWLASGRAARTGAAGLAELIADPGPFLEELSRRGVKAAVFDGAAP